ncbi:MAG TPA: 2OG-Fe(II) oxygenase, partial [Nitrospiraceae bacterium]|nr:2OG-Fe(II) oxygenase [Nitrospiraceae bacterium]
MAPNCESVEWLTSALSNTSRITTPYPHAVLDRFYDDATADAILRWMEEDAPWVLDVQSFYVQYECDDLINVLNTGATAPAVAPEMLDHLRQQLERIFETDLIAGRATVHAHKLLSGHAIGLHNDRPVRGVPSHRVIVHLNSAFDDSYGGHLVLLDRVDPEQSAVIVRPVHNSAILIEFSDHSWHCVDEVRAGTRYSIIYSFWHDDNDPLSEMDAH